jgi:O-antigen/teichoic acid export membrane protein
LRWSPTRTDLALATGAQALYKLIGYAVIVLLARHLPQAEMGAFFFAISLSYLFVSMADLGSESYLVRQLSARPLERTRALSDVWSVRIAALIPYFLGVNLFTWIAKPELTPIVALASLIIAFEDIYTVAGATLVGIGRLRLSVLFGVVTKLVLFGCVLGVALDGGDLTQVLLVYAAGHVVVAVGGAIVVLRTTGRFALHLDLRRIRMIVVAAFPLFVLDLMGMVHFKVDALMLGFLSTMSAVAVYESAFKMMEASRFVMRPITSVFYPLLCTHAAAAEWASVRRLTRKLLVGSVGMGGALALGAAIVADWLVPLTFGEAYEPSIGVMKILFLAMPAIFASISLGLVARSLGHERAVVPAFVIAIGANVVLDAFAIPRYGPAGAAWATVVSHAGLAIWLLVRVPRRLS